MVNLLSSYLPEFKANFRNNCLFLVLDEKWMEINEEEFNKLLETRFGLKGINLSNTPEALSLAINKFLNCASDVEGVEIKSDKPLTQFRYD